MTDCNDTIALRSLKAALAEFLNSIDGEIVSAIEPELEKLLRGAGFDETGIYHYINCGNTVASDLSIEEEA